VPLDCLLSRFQGPLLDTRGNKATFIKKIAGAADAEACSTVCNNHSSCNMFAYRAGRSVCRLYSSSSADIRSDTVRSV